MLLAISLATAYSRALLLMSFPLFPPVTATPTEPNPANPARASAVTEAFQPLSSDLFNFCALSIVLMELWELVMPTEYENFCDSVEVIPFQYPTALPSFSFSILIDLTPPSLS